MLSAVEKNKEKTLDAATRLGPQLVHMLQQQQHLEAGLWYNLETVFVK